VGGIEKTGRLGDLNQAFLEAGAMAVPHLPLTCGCLDSDPARIGSLLFNILPAKATWPKFDGHDKFPASSCLVDKVPVGSVPQMCHQAKHRVEGRSDMPSPIPAEDELVEVSLQMCFADAMEGAHGPALEVREYPVDPGQQDVGGHGADDLGLMPVIPEASVGCQAIADHRRATVDRPLDEASDASGGKVPERLQANSSGLAFLGQLDRANDQQFTHVAPALTPSHRIVLGSEREFAFVDFDEICKQRTFGINHSSAQLLEHQPSRLVAAQPELALELECRNAIRVAGDEMDRHEPSRQRQLRPMHHRSGRHRRLPTADCTFPGEPLAGKLPALQAATGGANEAAGPASFR
jgi:hypothetical protein